MHLDAFGRQAWFEDNVSADSRAGCVQPCAVQEYTLTLQYGQYRQFAVLIRIHASEGVRDSEFVRKGVLSRVCEVGVHRIVRIFEGAIRGRSEASRALRVKSVNRS